MTRPTLHWFTFLCTSLMTAGLLTLQPGVSHNAQEIENLQRIGAGTSLAFLALSLLMSGAWTQRGLAGAAGICAGNALDVTLEAMRVGSSGFSQANLLS